MWCFMYKTSKSKQSTTSGRRGRWIFVSSRTAREHSETLSQKQTTKEKEKRSKHYDVLNIEIYVKPDFVVILLFMLSLEKYKNFSFNYRQFLRHEI